MLTIMCRLVLVLLGSLFATGCVPGDSEGRATGPVPSLETRAVGGRVLGDADAAARVVRTGREVRPENSRANHRIPTRRQLAAFRRRARGQGVAAHVTGRFRGTTDEILQWAAQKWGLDVDLVRAQADAESDWRQAEVGDRGVSFGLMQIKSTVWRGSFPLTRRSTAFNVDLYGAIMRQAYDGRARWLEDEGYRAGDLWGTVGYYFSGHWYDRSARDYIRRVKLHLIARSWLADDF